MVGTCSLLVVDRCFCRRDERFLLKSVTRAEARKLLAQLAAYTLHMTRFPSSLLLRFYGLYRVAGTGGRKVCVSSTGRQLHPWLRSRCSVSTVYEEPARQSRTRLNGPTGRLSTWLTCKHSMGLPAVVPAVQTALYKHAVYTAVLSKPVCCLAADRL